MRRGLRYGIGIALVVGLVAVGARSAAAAEEMKACPICAKASSDTSSYPTKAGNMLVRGAANTLLGWTELIRQPAQTVKEGGNVFTGLARGLGYGIKRTAVGVGEVVTFWTPKMQDSYLHFAEDCPICMGKK